MMFIRRLAATAAAAVRHLPLHGIGEHFPRHHRATAHTFTRWEADGAFVRWICAEGLARR